MGFVFYLGALLLRCALLVAAATADDELCRVERTNVDAGEISLPMMSAAENCRWIVSAPPGRKLLVNIADIHLASENHSLTVSIDDSEYNVPRECERCWTNMVGEVLKVTFASSGVNVVVNVSENELFPEVTSNESYAASSSFSITYRSFDPRRCEAPGQTPNGYFLEKNWSKGSKVRYRCHSPYEPAAGQDEAITCVVLEDSPVPVWDGKPPECAIPPCDALLLNRTAGRGMIVHPGYPSKTVLPNQKCQWNIVAAPNRRIAVSVKNFGLPVGKGKHKGSKSFLEMTEGDGERALVRLQGQMSPQSLVTTTNQLTIVLQTGDSAAKANDAGGLFGFAIEYEATCEVLEPPANGSLTAGNLTVGSDVEVRCDLDFEADGESTLHCSADATWNSTVPGCAYVGGPTTSTAEASTPQSPPPRTLPSKGSKKSNVLHEQNAAEKEKEEKPPKDDDDVVPLDFDVVEDERVETMYKKSRPSSEEEMQPLDMLTVVMITLGVALPLLMLSASVGAYFWYRKRYPARMGFGRKFETFENPIYQKSSKRTPSGAGENNPAELQRLTVLSSP